MHAVNHAARSEEHQGFEESMCDDVKDADDEGAHTASEKHKAELRYGRVSEHALDIVLRDANRRNPGKQCEHESKVADAIRNESFAGGIRSFGAIEVVSDQKIGAEPDALPADEHHHEIRAHHQHEHRKHEQTHVGEESIIARV